MKKKKPTKKRQFIAYAFFCFIGLRNSNSFAAAILRFVMSGLWAGDASLGFGRRMVSQFVGRAGTSTSPRGCPGLPI